MRSLRWRRGHGRAGAVRPTLDPASDRCRAGRSWDTIRDQLRRAGLTMRHGGRPPHCASTQQILELRDQGATWNVVPKRVDMTVSGAWSHYRRTGRGYAARKITAATISGQLVAFSQRRLSAARSVASAVKSASSHGLARRRWATVRQLRDLTATTQRPTCSSSTWTPRRLQTRT